MLDARAIYLDRLFMYEDACLECGAHPDPYHIALVLMRRRELTRVVSDYSGDTLHMRPSMSDRPLAADEYTDCGE